MKEGRVQKGRQKKEKKGMCREETEREGRVKKKEGRKRKREGANEEKESINEANPENAKSSTTLS